MHVLLFDIDGTLISSGGAGGNALRGAFCAEFDISDPAQVPFAGRTDRGIAEDLFTHHGIENSDPNWQRLRSAYLERLPNELHACQGRVLDGVLELLSELQQRADVALGLLTGNTAAGARAKLQHYDVFQFFSFGGFGDEHPHRNQVARQAALAAEQSLNRPFNGDQTWVIGDTPLDIECARAIGARVAAVATGSHPREELAEQRPDVLLNDMNEFRSHIELPEF